MNDVDQRARRLVADAIARQIDGVSRVLVAGVTRADGVSTVMALLREQLATTHDVRPLSAVLERLEKPALFEGPALAEGPGFASLEEQQLRAFGGLVLVVRAEHAPRAALVQIAAWATARRLPLLGVVWNEGGPREPSLTERLRGVTRWLRARRAEAVS